MPKVKKVQAKCGRPSDPHKRRNPPNRDITPEALREIVCGPDLDGRPSLVNPGSIPLEVTHRNQDPRNGKTLDVEIVRLIVQRPQRYHEFLGSMIQGTSPHTAAWRFGWNSLLLKRWMIQGKTDIENQVDTLHSRFYLDIYWALACAASVSEQKLHEKDPLTYLTVGPGKYMHTDGLYQPPSRQLSPDRPMDPLELVDHSQVLESPIRSSRPTQETLLEAVEVMRKVGLDPEDPAFTEAHQEQHNVVEQELDDD